MASSTIQEFLVQLGFKIDEPQLGKFTSSLLSVSKQVVGISLALEGAAIALTAFTTKIASELENLFYSSQRAGTTIQNLQALQYAFGQTGQGAESAAAMMENFRMALRMNPAVEGFLQGLGIMTKGTDGKLKDTTALFESFISNMRQRLAAGTPFAILAQMAEQVGIGSNQLLQSMQMQPQRLAAEAQLRAKQGLLGFNPDAFGKTSVEFMNSLRDLGNTIETIFQKIGTSILPDVTASIKELNATILANHGNVAEFVEGIHYVVNAIKEDIDQEVKDFKSFTAWLDGVIAKIDAVKKFLHLTAPDPQDLGRTPQGLQNRLDQAGSLADKLTEGVYSGMKKAFEWLKSQGGVSPMSYEYTPEQRGAILAALHGDTAYGHATPASFNTGNTAATASDNLLDRVRQTESGGNNNAVSPAGAQGPYPFEPGTWARWGQGSPFNATAARAAASRYLNYLLQMFGGDVAKALAGYNWGEGRVAKDVSRWGDAWLQHAPPETQAYVNKILGGGAQGHAPAPVHIEQHNHIRSTDPVQAGQEVATRTRSIWSDIIRTMRQPGVFA